MVRQCQHSLLEAFLSLPEVTARRQASLQPCHAALSLGFKLEYCHHAINNIETVIKRLTFLRSVPRRFANKRLNLQTVVEEHFVSDRQSNQKGCGRPDRNSACKIRQAMSAEIGCTRERIGATKRQACSQLRTKMVASR